MLFFSLLLDESFCLQVNWNEQIHSLTPADTTHYGDPENWSSDYETQTINAASHTFRHRRRGIHRQQWWRDHLHGAKWLSTEKNKLRYKISMTKIIVVNAAMVSHRCRQHYWLFWTGSKLILLWYGKSYISILYILFLYYAWDRFKWHKWTET